MRRIIVLLLVAALILSGCIGKGSNKNSPYCKYSYEFLGSFDTVIQFVGYAESEDKFDDFAKQGQARFEDLHKLYDKYNDYPGLNNIKTINDNAGLKPVEVSQEIIDLIVFSKEWHQKTGGVVNIALGPVLNIWHDFREQGLSNPEQAQLPGLEELKSANALTNLNKVVVDQAKRTVFLIEPGMSLDIGAVAKGYATEIVAQELAKSGVISMVISSGGNVKLIGKPLDGTRSKWGIGIQDPNGNPLKADDPPLDTVFTTEQSIVSSGDYQRYYKVNGILIHHLIDPKTLLPATHYRAVTTMVKDSGLADFMSTTLFLLPFEESKAMAEMIEGVEVLWVFPDGHMEATEGMKKALKNMGGATSK